MHVADETRDHVIEKLEFADYDSLEDSCADYAWLITQGTPYRAAWQGYQIDHGFHALAEAVAYTYATDPNYAHLVVNIASQPNIVQAIGFARQEAAADSTGDAHKIAL